MALCADGGMWNFREMFSIFTIDSKLRLTLLVGIQVAAAVQQTVGNSSKTLWHDGDVIIRRVIRHHYQYTCRYATIECRMPQLNFMNYCIHLNFNGLRRMALLSISSHLRIIIFNFRSATEASTQSNLCKKTTKNKIKNKKFLFFNFTVIFTVISLFHSSYICQSRCKTFIRWFTQQLQQIGSAGCQCVRCTYRTDKIEIVPVDWCQFEESNNDDKFMGRTIMVWLQIEMGAEGVWWRGNAACAVGSHMATGHCAVQQVSRSSTVLCHLFRFGRSSGIPHLP